jgi:predicted O-methyltransferase YrrM
MIFTEEIVQYAENFTSGESAVLKETSRHCYAHYEDSAMLSGFVQGRVLSMFSKMIRPKVVLEIGTYLGYSALCFAEGLAEAEK